MKGLLYILFFISLQANATVYYVANEGSDAADGLTELTAWQTIAKVNSTATTGDSILLKRGSVWNERLNVPAASMYFGAYGTGVKPELTGFATVTGFTNVGNIWSKTISNSVKYQNTVLINGNLTAKGRFPNTGIITVSSAPTQYQVVTATLTGTPNYTGAECVLRSAHWIWDICKITSQSSATLNMDRAFKYSPFNGNANSCFIQNIESVLDLQNEWSYDSLSKELKIYSTTEPTNVKISTLDTLVFVSKKNNVTFDSITISGANSYGIRVDKCRDFTFKNRVIKNCGAVGIGGLKYPKLPIQNDSIMNIFDNGIYFYPYFVFADPLTNGSDSSLIDNNYIKNIGYKAGMGRSDNIHYEGIMIVGDRSVITNNRVDSIGYNAIAFNGRNVLVKNNFVSNYCFIKDDGAGLYVGGIGGGPTYPNLPIGYDSGTIVRGNIIINGIGNTEGTGGAYYSAGIYMDDFHRKILIDSNTIYNCLNAGIHLHQSDSITVRGNTIINGTGPAMSIRTSTANATVDGNDIKGNIFYSSSADYTNFYTTQSSRIGRCDSNYYSRPSSSINNFNLNGSIYSFAEWKSATSRDAASQLTPNFVTADNPLFYYNATLTPSVVYLSGTYMDIRGVIYTDSVTIQPFRSVILYKSTFNVYPRVISNFKFYKLN